MEMKETEHKHAVHTHDHSMMMDHSMDHSKMDHSKMDHSKMNHDKMDYAKCCDTNPPMDMEAHNHHEMMIEDIKKRFWISLAISVPVLALSAMIQQFFGFSLSFPGD